MLEPTDSGLGVLDDIENHLGNDLSSLEGRVSVEVKARLDAYEGITLQEFYLPVIDYFLLAHQLGGKSHTDLAKEVGVGKSTVRKIFLLYNLPILDRKEAAKRKWADLEFRAKQADIARKTLEKLKQDAEFVKKQAAASGKVFHELWENNPEFGQKVSERSRGICYQNWQNPEFRQRQHDGLEKELERRWYHDPDFRRRFNETHAESTQRTWQDSQFRARIAQASRDARYCPEGLASKMHIPAIHGYRGDIRFYAQSMMEANLARVFLLLHMSFSRRRTFLLNVPDTYLEAIGMERTRLTVDFVARDRRGQQTVYEIMAHPLESPVGWAKLELLQQQFPHYRVVVVDPTYYNQLRQEFQGRIIKAVHLRGWETSQDNLRTNPAKYA